jgi:hypothetical protein
MRISLQTLALMRSGRFLLAGVDILSSVALCLVTVWAEALATHWILGLAK